jgi:2-polyprenyl-6-methoxyphenol hydroxylase-like FAD-dependent oxidoreductase
MSQLSVAVVGAGVVGLTTAISLLERGYEVTIVADRFPKCMNVPEDYTSETFDVYESTDVLVSDVAAASFIPHTEKPTSLQVKMLQESAKMFWEHSKLPSTYLKPHRKVVSSPGHCIHHPS